MGNARTNGGEAIWCNGYYSAVHERLLLFLESGIRRLPPGTEGVVVRAQAHFGGIGDAGAVARLEAISLSLVRIQRAIWAGDEGDFERQAQRLDEAARAWFAHAPMFPPCEALDAEQAA
jgi:hypothetical protein